MLDNPGKEERRGLHWHFIARFPAGRQITDGYTITWPQGHLGEFPLAEGKQRLDTDQLRQFRDLIRCKIRQGSILDTIFIDTEEVPRPYKESL